MSDAEQDLPKEIGRGVVELFPGLKIEVISLDNGQRLMTEESMIDFMNFLSSSSGSIIASKLQSPPVEEK